MSTFLLNLALRGAGLAPVVALPAAPLSVAPVQEEFEEVVEEQTARRTTAEDPRKEERESAQPPPDRTEHDQVQPREPPPAEALRVPPRSPIDLPVVLPAAPAQPPADAMREEPAPALTPGERIERVVEKTTVERHTERVISEPPAAPQLLQPPPPQPAAVTEIREITREVLRPAPPAPIIERPAHREQPVESQAVLEKDDAAPPVPKPKPPAPAVVAPRPDTSSPVPREQHPPEPSSERLEASPPQIGRQQRPLLQPRTLPDAQREQRERPMPFALPRAAPPPASMTPAKPPSPETEREISVHIGTIEIKAPPAPPPTPAPPASQQAVQDFSEYRALRSYGSWFRG